VTAYPVPDVGDPADLLAGADYHGYELSPTSAELRAWRDEVERLIKALGRWGVNDHGSG